MAHSNDKGVGGFPDAPASLLVGSARTLGLGWVVSSVTQSVERATWGSAHPNGISYALFIYFPAGFLLWALPGCGARNSYRGQFSTLPGR